MQNKVAEDQFAFNFFNFQYLFRRLPVPDPLSWQTIDPEQITLPSIISTIRRIIEILLDKI
jgi:hypothetical protein